MFRRKPVRSDFPDEIAAHIRLEADRLRDRGMSEEEALAAARRAFGNVTHAQELFYESSRYLWWDSLTQDVRLAFRLLAKTPGWTFVAALTVALGIGATAAIFSIVNTVLLRPLPFPHAAQLYAVIEAQRLTELVHAADYFSMRESLRGDYGASIQEMAAYDSAGVNWTAGDRAERLVAGLVTASFFPTLQAQPLYGRTFRPEEDQPGADKVVVLSYGLWRRRFGADPAIVGQKIRLDRAAAVVIGIMPRWFDFPQRTDLWLPIALDEEAKNSRILESIARASDRATAADVNQELLRLTSVVLREDQRRGFRSDDLRILARPLQEQLTGNLRPALLVFSGAVGLMLLIVCFTVANLMLARATTRQREITVRLALGAPRRRIAGQLLTETLLVSLFGGGLGLGWAVLAVAALNSTRITALPGLPEVSVDLSTAMFTLAVTLLTGVVFGLAPLLGSIGFEAKGALQGASRNVSSGVGLQRVRRTLAVAQLGLSLTLLVGAGLLAKSFYQLRRTNPGYNPTNVLTARINLTGPTYASIERQKEFIENLLQQASRLPNAEAASIGPIPPGVSGNVGIFTIENQPFPAEAPPPFRALMDVSPDYFRVMGVPLLEGRPFADTDAVNTPMVAVANQAFAERYFPGSSPLGRRVSTIQADPHDPGWAEIVGVVGNVRQTGLDHEVMPTVYLSFAQERLPFLRRANLLIRASHDPASLEVPLEKLVVLLDRDQPVFDAKTMEQRLEDSLGSRRFDAALTGAFALTAMFLASIGVYGVMSYLVSSRTSEIGIRLALGARREQVLGLILREGMLLAMTGIALGVGGALGLSRYLAALLYGVGARDPETFTLAVLVLFAAVMSACTVPGRRAAQVDPVTALRHD